MSFCSPPISIDGPSGSRMTHHLNTSNVLHVHHVSSCDECRVTIDILPDNVLLLVFSLDRLTYLDGLEGLDQSRPSWRWHRLVQVCRRWRSVVFASPNTLDLRLVCGPSTCVELTPIWPPFPVIIRNMISCPMHEEYDFGAAIVHRTRVCEIELFLRSSQLQRLASAMQEQFPALIHLRLHHVPDSLCHLAPVLPKGLLGGFAPQLQTLELNSIPFPALPKLLLSASDLVYLDLRNIPHFGYFSPEAIATGLAVSANLKSLRIGFEYPQSLPDRESRHPLPSTRIVLPALTHFEFKGVSKWLEDLVARINAPLLESIRITFFHQLVLEIVQLAQFMRRTTMFQALDEAHMDIGDDCFRVGSIQLTQNSDKVSGLIISCEKMDQQLSSLVQVITSVFPIICMVEDLHIYGSQYALKQWQDDTENAGWLEIFHPFTVVKNLYVCKKFARRMVPDLQELVRATDVLPTLNNLFLKDQSSGTVKEAIRQFVAARQLLGHPISVFYLNGK